MYQSARESTTSTDSDPTYSNPDFPEVGDTMPIYVQPEMPKNHSNQKKLAADTNPLPQEGVSNPGDFQL